MRSRAIRPARVVGLVSRPRRIQKAALVFLRGGDADARLRELASQRSRARPLLGALAVSMVKRRAFEALGFRCLGDWSRERLGVGARCIREWARVWLALDAVPRLRAVVLSGQLSWTVARRIAAHVTPENQDACIETARNRTVRAVEILLKAAQLTPREPGDDDRVPVRLACPPRIATQWAAALELARRVAGEPLAAWECAEAIAAECASAFGAVERGVSGDGGPPSPVRRPREPRSASCDAESGLRTHAWPHLAWAPYPASATDAAAGPRPPRADETPRQLDRRFRAAIAFLQRVDFEIGRILRQILDRKLYRELGFESFERYVVERLDLSARTARRLVRIARAEAACAEVATAFREGHITLLQAEVLLRGGASGRLEEALRVTLRRLEDQIPEREVSFWAPPEVAALFLALVARLGLEKMLAHAIATWLQVGRSFRDYADFERDGWRCSVPACSARRNLQSHHIRFRSAGGPDVAWNRTTLCAFHHQRGVHGGALAIRGRAPHGLVFELGVGRPFRFLSGDRWLTAAPGP